MLGISLRENAKKKKYTYENTRERCASRTSGYMKSTYKSVSPSPSVGDTQTKIISSECWWNFFEILGL